MGLEQKLGNMGVVTTTLETAINWGRTNAMWPMLFGLACCAMEMISTVMPDNDMARFGMELMRASPRQSDLMIVAGRVSRKMAPVLRPALLDVLRRVKGPPELNFPLLASLTAWDNSPTEPRFHVIYKLREMTRPSALRVKVLVPGDDPVLPTVTGLFINANWHERE